MPREYIATPPPSRPGAPWFLKVNGAVSYATNGDTGYESVPLNEEQYDWMYRSVMGQDVPDVLKVRVTNFPPGGSTPSSFTLTGDITAVE